MREYYKFFDETLKSGTLTVVIIALIIISLGGISRPAYAYETDQRFQGANIMQTNITTPDIQRVIIDGVEYEVEFRRVK